MLRCMENDKQKFQFPALGMLLVVVFCGLMGLVVSPAFGYQQLLPQSSAVSKSVAMDARVHTHGDWVPPIPGATPGDVLRPFDNPSKPWASGHRGIDLAGGPQVVAPAAGTVKFVGQVVDRPVLTIEHADGTLSSFEPVISELEVGDAVSVGQTIGSVDPDVAHCETSCVHWGVRIPNGWHIDGAIRDLYIDPQLLLGWNKPSVLWPVHSDPWWA